LGKQFLAPEKFRRALRVPTFSNISAKNYQNRLIYVEVVASQSTVVFETHCTITTTTTTTTITTTTTTTPCNMNNAKQRQNSNIRLQPYYLVICLYWKAPRFLHFAIPEFTIYLPICTIFMFVEKV